MSKLAEIEAAAAALRPEEQQELLLFLTARLRDHRAKPPEPRTFSEDQLSAWIAADEAGGVRYKDGR